MTLPGIASLPLLVSDFRLSLAASPFWYVLLALVLLALAFAVYRFTLPPVGVALRTVLWTIRGLALMLILFMIFEPVVSYVFDRSERPTIALLIDRSASMATEDDAGSRSGALGNFLRSHKDRFASAGRLRTFAFADTVEELSPDSLLGMRATGVGSNPADAWQRAEQVLAAENLAAIVLVSDGAQNLGPNPARVAAESSVPIFAVGVGDTSLRKDAVIGELLTNEITYVGSKVPVDIRLRADGLAGTSSRLRLLKSGGGEIAAEAIRFSSPNDEVAASMEFTADVAGDVRITAVLDSVPGEISIANNSRSVMVRVLDSRSRVLLISGPPTADLTFIRQFLESDSTLRVENFVEIQAGQYLNGKLGPTDESVRDAELIVLINYPTGYSSTSTLSAIQQSAVSSGTPLLFFAGPDLYQDRLSALNDVLPAHLTKSKLSSDRVLVRAAAGHPVMTGGDYNPAQWLELPPVDGGAGNFVVVPGSVTVAKLSRETAGIDEDEPAVVFSERSNRRVAAVLCWNTYRWRLGVAKDNRLSGFFDGLLSRTVRWLIAPVEERRVKITTTKRLYSGGETVRFTGQIYGADLKPRDDAAIDLRVESGDRVDVVPMRGRGSGRYDGNFIPWAEGDYRFSAVASVDGDTLGSDAGQFAVETFNIELIDPRARFDVLRQIAANSGGRFASIQSPDSVLDALRFEPATITTARELPLWNRATMLWVIILLLAAEWTIRKRSGML